jgi:hypothetical protein
MTVEEAQDVVMLDYNELINLSSNLSPLIATAFGSDPSCLGVLLVKNVPNLPLLRSKLLKTASVFASLPEPVKEKYVHTPSTFLNGWSHGKEVMNGKADFAKGSYYNNPVYNSPPGGEGYKDKHPEYGHDNVWPSDVCPQMEDEFMQLGQLVIQVCMSDLGNNNLRLGNKDVTQVGKLVASRCDKYISSLHPDLPANFMHTKGRLLHYFPMTEDQVVQTPDGKNMDSWYVCLTCKVRIAYRPLTSYGSNECNVY